MSEDEWKMTPVQVMVVDMILRMRQALDPNCELEPAANDPDPGPETDVPY